MGNILLVEDSEEDLQLFAEGFRAFGRRAGLQIARTPSWALHELRGHKETPTSASPRLLLLAVGNATQPAFDLLRALKADPILRRIPVVVFAPRGQPDLLPLALREHANCALLKPQEPDAFVALVKATLEIWLGVAQLPMLHPALKPQPAFAIGGVDGVPVDDGVPEPGM